MKEQVAITTVDNIAYLDIGCLNSKESGLLYFKLPQFLMTSRFAGLSSDGKVVYSAMLNRLPLSVRNGYKLDNLFYIYFSIETVMSLINCSKSKAVRVMKELKTFQLIEGRRCKDHRHMRYFFLDVSAYMTQRELCTENVPDPDNAPDTTPDPDSPDESFFDEIPEEPYDEAPLYEDDFAQDYAQEQEQTDPTGVNFEPDWSQFDTCTGVKSEPEQVSKVDRKKTEPSKTDFSYQDLLHQEPAHSANWRWWGTKEELQDTFSAIWKENGMYTDNELQRLDSLIDTVSTILSRKEAFHISNEIVKSGEVYLQLVGLGYDEIRYALDYLYNGVYKCSNYSSYAISVLYNAPQEAIHYLSNQFRYEQYGQQRQQQMNHYGYGYEYGYAG